MLSTSAQAMPTHAELRFSTRRAAKVSTYNEDESDDFEEEALDLTPNYWANTYDESVPAIDAILNHRPREDISKHCQLCCVRGNADDAQDRDLLNPGRDDFEYYVSITAGPVLSSKENESKLRFVKVKWQGKAHYHATWENNATLASCRGIRRLENYFRKIVLEDIRVQNDEDVPPEEKEKHSLDRERDIDALTDYCKVERVIGSRESEDGQTEYFVKCALKAFVFSFLLTVNRARALL